MLNFLQKVAEAMMEAQRRRAAFHTAQILQHNRDFKNWSFHEIYHHILDEKNPVGLDKQPI